MKIGRTVLCVGVRFENELEVVTARVEVKLELTGGIGRVVTAGVGQERTDVMGRTVLCVGVTVENGLGELVARLEVTVV